jgi:hypothetical protein
VRVGVVADECKNTLTHRPFYESHTAVVILPFSRLTPSRPSSSSKAAQRIVVAGIGRRSYSRPPRAVHGI